MKRAAFAFVALSTLVPARAHAKGCTEHSDIVGERHCSRYGDFWSSERTIGLVASVGLVHASLAPDDRHWRAGFTKNSPDDYEFDSGQLGKSMSMWGPDMRVHAFVTPWLYLGTDLALLFGHGDVWAVDSSGYHATPASGVNLIDGRFAWVTGVRAPLMKDVSFRVELLTGLEGATLRQDATFQGSPHGTASANHVEFLLQPRFNLDLWTGPWTSIGLWMGTKPLHTNDLDFGLNFAIHGRPHDG